MLAALVAPAIRGQSGKDKMFGDAEAYERFMGRWSSQLAPALVAFTEVPDAGEVLDVGSGTGALAFSVAKLKPHCRVVGLDPSQEYVEYAKSRSSYRERVSFEVGDAQQMAYPKGRFQTSLSLLVFNFIPDSRKALGEVRRVTQPKGWISAAVWDYGAGMQMLRTYWDAAKSLDPAVDKLDEMHSPLCRAGELSDLWKQGGLEQVEERPLEITMQFVSFADYWEPFLLGQGPAGAYLRKVPDTGRDALRAEVKRRLGLTSEQVPFSLTARAWAVRGRA